MEYPKRNFPDSQVWWTDADIEAMDDAWYDQQIERMNAGDTVVLPRNTDRDACRGRVWDLFVGNDHLGMIDDGGEAGAPIQAYYGVGESACYIGESVDFNTVVSLILHHHDLSASGL